MRFSAKCFEQVKFFVEKSRKLPLPPLPSVSELIRLYRVRATKQLSQNFLYDPSIIDRFVCCLSKRLEGHYACEVGPGPGSITRCILDKGVEHLTVVEKDRRFLPMLQYIGDVVNNRLTVVHGDILTYDISSCFPIEYARKWDEECPPFCVFGNLPFNISLPLLFQWLDLISKKDGAFKLGRIPLVLTYQYEVAERFTAGIGNPQRSRLSVVVQNFCDVKHHFTMSGGAFVPKPKVDVAAVMLTPKRQFDINLPYKTIDHVVKHVLTGQRKRPCKFGVATLFPPQRKDLVDEIFQLSGVQRETRPAMLDNYHFRDLCYAYEEIVKRIPQLKLVDTYDPKQWQRKYFDSHGFPVSTTDKENSAEKDPLSVLENLKLDEPETAYRKIRRNRKRKRAAFVESTKIEPIIFNNFCDNPKTPDS